MKPQFRELLDTMKKFNSGDMSKEVFGLEKDTVYDALVVAPGWKPTKILTDPAYQVTVLAVHSYVSGYLVEKDGLKIAWLQTASGACNLLDHLAICGELHFKKLIFAGAVGSLVPEFQVGDLCTPSVSIAGVYANAYFCGKLADYVPMEPVYPGDYVNCAMELARESGYEMKQAKVYCTDSIVGEYIHLPEIRATGAQLIEMETSTFFRLADLMEVPAVALLAVSDNSATGDPLLGANRDRHEAYCRTRSTVIPDLIVQIAKDTK